MLLSSAASDGQAGCNTRVDHCSGLSHDATSLHMSEAVHEGTHWPLHSCRHCESDEPQGWAQNPAMARVTHTTAFEAQGHTKWTTGWVSWSSCCGCNCAAHLVVCCVCSFLLFSANKFSWRLKRVVHNTPHPTEKKTKNPIKFTVAPTTICKHLMVLSSCCSKKRKRSCNSRPKLWRQKTSSKFF